MVKILVYIVKYLIFHHKDALSLQQQTEKKTLISFCQLPAFKHGDITVNESVAACLYLEVKCKNATALISKSLQQSRDL